MGASTGFADSITYINFTDQHKYWLQGEGAGIDWHNNSNSFGYVDDNLDVIGTPNMLGGTIGLTSTNHLASISVNYTNGSGLEKIGDLFLDTNSDNFWDYVVKIYNAPGKANGVAGTYDMYSAHIDVRKGTNAQNTASYELSGSDNTGIWAGYVIRDNSPYAAKTTALGSVVGQVQFSGWSTAWGPNTSTFTFDVNSLPGFDGSTPLTIAWEPNCANDVLFERVSMPVVVNNVVPEPSSFILLGSGLLGLLGASRRKKQQVEEA